MSTRPLFYRSTHNTATRFACASIQMASGGTKRAETIACMCQWCHGRIRTGVEATAAPSVGAAGPCDTAICHSRSTAAIRSPMCGYIPGSELANPKSRASRGWLAGSCFVVLVACLRLLDFLKMCKRAVLVHKRCQRSP